MLCLLAWKFGERKQGQSGPISFSSPWIRTQLGVYYYHGVMGYVHSFFFVFAEEGATSGRWWERWKPVLRDRKRLKKRKPAAVPNFWPINLDPFPSFHIFPSQSSFQDRRAALPIRNRFHIRLQKKVWHNARVWITCSEKIPGHSKEIILSITIRLLAHFK